MSINYEARILRVLDYIHDYPAGDLSLDRLAEVAAMSRFHWHRVFHGITGETCAQAARRIRLHRAACWLVQTDLPLAEVGARCGYPATPAFSRAFQEAYGMPPGQFRKSGVLRALNIPTSPGERKMYSVDIETHPERHLASIDHQGDYTEIGRVFEQLGALMTTRTLWPQVQGMLGIYYDDPDAVAAKDLKSSAAVILAPGTEIAAPLEPKTLAGGRMAVLHFKGPYAGLKPAYDYLFGQWLPGSGEKMADQPCFEIYLNSPADTAPEDLLTEICLPLA